MVGLDMNEFEWQGYTWKSGAPWGIIHPDNTRQWYDESAIELRNNELILKTQYNPKYFPELDTTSNIGVGLVHCPDRLRHGIYEIEAVLPAGKRLWPAFWLTAWDQWPPEIDVFEAYTNRWGNYLHWDWRTPFAFLNVKTNVHYGSYNAGTKEEIGGRSKYFTLKDPRKNIMRYTLLWLPDRLKIMYNGKLVREVTDQEILSDINRFDMYIVLNNAVNEDADLNDEHVTSEFRITKFRYTEYPR